MPEGPPSRPNPDSPYPPNAAAGSKRLNVLSQTTPTLSAEAIAMARDPFSVQTPADSPYGVLFALATASSGVRKVSTVSTGPKISSRTTRIEAAVPLRIVGGTYQPRSGTGQDERQTSAPSLTPEATSSVLRVSCRLELIAPTSVFLSDGSPIFTAAARLSSRATSSSAIGSCTSSREPAQQT